MIPTFEKITKKGNKTSNFFIAFLGASLIISSIVFVGIGLFNMLYALFTDYTATALDILYFLTGMTMLFLATITTFVSEIKSQNKTIAKGIVHLLRNKLNEPKSNLMSRGLFDDNLKNLFNFPPLTPDSEMTGSISIVDLSNPDKPLYTGDFKSMDEMNEMKKELINKMLNSKREFKGKKMTKQEMLDTMTIEELKKELKQAVESEDWLWAASIRDKISEKEGNEDTDKKEE